MKNLVVIFLMTFPIHGFSQSKDDYNAVVGKFINYYNNGQLDSINSILSYYKWDEESLKLIKNLYGKIKSFQYMVIDSTDLDRDLKPSTYFAGECSKEWLGRKTHAMCFWVSEENKITTMRFMTQSEHTDSMLNKYFYKISK